MKLRARRIGSGLLAAILGIGAAVALAAGDGDVAACANKKSGTIHAAGPKGRCSAGSFAITIGGEAFKASRGGTLTINGTAFKAGKGNVITINGTSFDPAAGKCCLTIDSWSFRRNGPNTLTINGVPLTGTIPALERVGPTGPRGLPGATGPQGAPGPTGPRGEASAGSAPAVASGPITVDGGSSATLATKDVTITGAHRLLVVGGFNAVCNPCSDNLVVGTTIARSGAAEPLVRRRLPTMGPGGVNGTSAAIAEVVVTLDVCNPCTYSIGLTVPAGQGGAVPAVQATEVRLGLVDLGTVAP